LNSGVNDRRARGFLCSMISMMDILSGAAPLMGDVRQSGSGPPRRDLRAARRFFERAIGTTRTMPSEVVTDRAPTYPVVLEELLPAAWHDTERYANNRVECDHGRLKARLRPMRGLKQDRSARIVIAGHAFLQNIRRGALRAGGRGASEQHPDGWTAPTSI
jgi:hypothetical protein